MQGIAQDSFGWSADQFWAATPHEFWSMIDARYEANKR
jgi:hypothetical protein